MYAQYRRVGTPSLPSDERRQLRPELSQQTELCDLAAGRPCATVWIFNLLPNARTLLLSAEPLLHTTHTIPFFFLLRNIHIPIVVIPDSLSWHGFFLFCIYSIYILPPNPSREVRVHDNKERRRRADCSSPPFFFI